MRQSRKKWERKREEQRNKVIALLFIVMMVIFCVVNIATADRGFSAKENRALEQRPKLTICIGSVCRMRFLGSFNEAY